MREVWTTKYGKRRVRHAPPVLAEAILAASGLTDDPEQQAQLAAELIGADLDEVKAEMKRASSKRRPIILTSTDRKGLSRAVVVERRPSRVLIGARTLSRP